MGTDEKDGDRLAGDAEIATRLSMSRSWVRKQRHRRKHGKSHFLTIEPVMVGGKSPRYWATEVDAFIETLKPANDDAADEGGEK